jgi:citrate lyase gamma subunit
MRASEKGNFECAMQKTEVVVSEKGHLECAMQRTALIITEKGSLECAIQKVEEEIQKTKEIWFLTGHRLCWLFS